MARIKLNKLIKLKEIEEKIQKKTIKKIYFYRRSNKNYKFYVGTKTNQIIHEIKTITLQDYLDI